MARVSDVEVEKLKRDVSLVRLATTTTSIRSPRVPKVASVPSPVRRASPRRVSTRPPLGSSSPLKEGRCSGPARLCLEKRLENDGMTAVHQPLDVARPGSERRAEWDSGDSGRAKTDECQRPSVGSVMTQASRRSTKPDDGQMSGRSRVGRR